MSGNAPGTSVRGGTDTPDLDVVVVGAGLAGLVAAHTLRAAGREVRVFEGAPRLGGRAAPRRRDGYLLDAGATAITDRGYPVTWEVIRALQLPSEMLQPTSAQLAVWRDGLARPGRRGRAPTGVLSRTARLSWRATTTRGRLQGGALSPDHPEDTPFGEATVAEWALRHHPDIASYLLQPLAATFGWRPERAVMSALFLHLTGTGRGRLVSGPEGLDALVRGLADRVEVALGRRVLEVKPGHGRVRVGLSDGGAYTARAVVLAVPAPVALDVHADLRPDERAYLESCVFTPAVRVSCLLDRPLPSPAGRPVHTLLLPGAERRMVCAIGFGHHVRPDRAPSGRGIVSMAASPTAAADLLRETPSTIARVLAEEAEPYVADLADATTGSVVHRYRYGMPMVSPATLRLRRDFVRRPVRAVEYAGDWVLANPTVEGAIRSGRLAAQRLGSLRN